MPAARCVPLARCGLKIVIASTQNTRFLPYEVLCHCEALPNRGSPRDTVYSRGKAHTSKRVSIAAPDNAISKEQFAPHLPEGLPYKTPRKILYNGPQRDAVYPFGKGVCERKTDICRLRRLSGQE